MFRFKRDKLCLQLREATSLKEMSDRRQERVERSLQGQQLDTFRGFVAKREQLLRAQRAVEEAERSILPDI